MPSIDLDTLRLEHGAHSSPEQGMCVMEAVAFMAGEPFSDHPECASPVISAFMRAWNDGLPDAERQLLKPYIPRLIGTRTTEQDEQTRAWMATDWLARECAPAFLRIAGLTEQAELVEALAPLADIESAQAAQPVLEEARKTSDAAWDAARDAARDAAWAAARAAAWAAAEKGGGYTEQYTAAYKVAKPLIDEKFAPITPGLQASALQLLDRMIAVGTDATAGS